MTQTQKEAQEIIDKLCKIGDYEFAKQIARRHFPEEYLQCLNQNPFTEEEQKRIAARLEDEQREDDERRKRHELRENCEKFFRALTPEGEEYFANALHDWFVDRIKKDIHESKDVEMLKRLKEEGSLSVEEEYDLRIRHLDVATRCSRCRFLKSVPNKWGFPNFQTCGRDGGCIFCDFKEKLSKFQSDESGYKRGINGFESAFIKDGKIYII